MLSNFASKLDTAGKKVGGKNTTKGTDMNYLHRLIKLRGLTFYDIAAGTGYGYHSIQKAVTGDRKPLKIREAIARYLQIDSIKAFGRGSAMYLRHQVALEANKQAETHRKELLKKYCEEATLPAKRKAVNV